VQERSQPSFELPHTVGCLVCGRDNPHGLHLKLYVDAAGVVTTQFTPCPTHIGFTGVSHGGILATVFDEAMVWAATWSGKRFCYCGEMTVRFRQPALVGMQLTFSARIETARSRIITTTATAVDADGRIVAESSGKYVPLPPEKNEEFVATLVDDPATRKTASQFA